METFFEFSKEVLKGIVCVISAHLFRKTLLDKEKTTRRVVTRYCTPRVRVENLTLGVFYMAKYSGEFKLKVVKKYLEGSLGYKFITKRTPQ